jgi:streptomycin 6-kinase
MSLLAEIPIPADLAARYSRSSAGRAWLVSLPGLLRGCLERWNLTVDLAPGAVPWNGQGGIVVPVLLDSGLPAALKVSYPQEEARLERNALMLWNGRGAVRLLESDAGTCAMLLERLDASRSLGDVPVDKAAAVWGGLMRQLSLTPDDRFEWLELDHVAARAEQWSDDLPVEWEQLGRPFPRWLLEAALEVCQTRGAVGRRASNDVLVHSDFHFLNVLARLDGSWDELGSSDEFGASDGFAAIAPQPLVGEAEFAVAPLLWNRISELSPRDPETALRERCLNFSLAAGLDPEVARQWSVAREVENALWYAGHPNYSGDLARSLWVASTLAGRTLDGLPPAHALPEPGLGAFS